MSVRLRTLAVAGLLAGTLVVLNPLPASAASFTVTVLTDSVDASPGNGTCADSGGDCSLRAAIQEANASAGADTINLPPGIVTLILAGPGEEGAATGDLDVTSQISIVGAGGSEIRNNSDDRIFEVKAGANLNIDGVLLTLGTAVDAPSPAGGGSGGAVLNAGTFTASDSTFGGNSAVRAGGAIEASAGSNTTLADSVLLRNTASSSPGNGGAIHITGAATVTITGGEFNENVASSEGGGLWVSATGILNVDDVDIYGNDARGAASDNGGGGIFNDGGTLTVSDSSVSDNGATGTSGSGGGIFNGGTAIISDTGVDRNYAPRAGGGIEAIAGSTTTMTGGSMFRNEAGVNPGNGGGLHITGAGTVDITSVRVEENTAENEGGGLWNSAVGTMSVTGSAIDDNTASGAMATNGGGGIFNQPNMTNTGGGNLTVAGSTITGNDADGVSGSGGGIFNGGTATITDIGTSISSNTAQRAGGGIEAVGGSTTSMTDGRIATNQAGPMPGNGGGLHVSGNGSVDLIRTDVVDNVAANEGGGLWNSAVGTMSVTDAFVARNTASGAMATNGGGGIFNQPNMAGTGGGTLAVTGGGVQFNTANGTSGSGGAILNGGSATVTNVQISENRANRAGGGIETVGGSTTEVSGIFMSRNSVNPNPGNGGGMHVGDASVATIDASFVQDNSAANQGGGLWVSGAGSMTVRTTDVSGNTATNMGGGIYNDGGTLLAQNSLVYDNTAADGGGVHAANEGDTTLQHVTVVTNSAPTGSGISTDAVSTMTLTNSIVSANTGGGFDCNGNIVSNGGNVTDTCTVAGPEDVTGVADPQLNAAFVPQPGSPAIDQAIQANSLSDDYYGTSRPRDGDANGTFISDSGAVEAPGSTPPIVTDDTIPPGGSATPGSATPDPTTSTTIGDGITPSTSAPGNTAPDGLDDTTPGGPGGTTPGSDIQGDNGNQGSNGGLLARTGANTHPLTLLGLSLLTMGAIFLVLRNRRRLMGATKR